MNVLVATHRLAKVSGTEKYTYALLEEFVRRGDHVEYFCLERGEVGDRIERDLGVNWMTRRSYDLVLANHWPVVDRLSRRGLLIQTVHGIFPFLERPSWAANGHVAVSREVQDHLARMGIASITILNGINCASHRPTRTVSERLDTVLSMVHSQEAMTIVEEACALLGVRFTSLDKYGGAVWDVVTPINEADLVVGVGRTAYDAMACGRPVIAFDCRPYSTNQSDGYLPETLGFSLTSNCSGRWGKERLDAQGLSRLMLKYRPEHGAQMREFAEQYLNIRKAVDDYLEYADDLQSGRRRPKRRENYAYKATRFARKILGKDG